MARRTGHRRASVLSAFIAGAPASSSETAWEAPAECPDAAVLRDVIEHHLGPRADEVSLQGRVQRASDGFEADVELWGSWGRTQRHLTSRRCDALVDAVALIAAVSVTLEEQPPAPATATVVPPVATQQAPGAPTQRDTQPAAPDPMPPKPVAEVEASEQREDSSRTPRSGPFVAAEMVAGRGTLPTVDLGGGVVAGWAWPRLRVAVTGRAYGPRGAQRRDRDDVRARFWSWWVGARACPVVQLRDRLDLPVCAGLEAGAIEAQPRGDGFVSRRSTRAPLVQAVAGPILVVDLGRRFAARIGVEAFVPLFRPSFALGGVIVHSPAAIGARAAAGLEVRFF